MLPATWLPPRGVRLKLHKDEVLREDAGPLLPLLKARLSAQRPSRVVLLGAFGSGKTTLSGLLRGPGVVVVPLRLLVRGGSIEARWAECVGDPDAVRDGRLRVVLDGLDEIARPGEGGYPALFEAITALAGERWLMTSRTGYFRTAGGDPAPHQVDSLRMHGVETLEIAPLSSAEVTAALGQAPIPELCSSPILLRLCLEGGIADAQSPAEVVDRYLRALGCDLEILEAAGWAAFQDRGLSEESASFPADALESLMPGQPLDRLLVRDADGRARFGHRSLYDFLVARRLGPMILANQGDERPNAASGLGLSEAMRIFLCGLIQEPPRHIDGDRVLVPAGNWISGGDHAPDERPLKIQHLERPVWLARRPVTEGEIATWLAEAGPRPYSYSFLRHWRSGAPLPGTEPHPTYNLRPSDADAYAEWAGARLPTWREWEKGTRGVTGARYPWGDHPDPDRANTAERGVEGTLPADALGPQGPTDLYAAIGDVFECTSSFYRDRPDRGRVVMGGSFAHSALAGRAGLRLSHTLSGYFKIGLRLAWSATPDLG